METRRVPRRRLRYEVTKRLEISRGSILLNRIRLTKLFFYPSRKLWLGAGKGCATTNVVTEIDKRS